MFYNLEVGIFYRLLGPTTAADVLQLTNSLNTQAGPSHTRVVLSNSDLRIISRPEEDILEDLWVRLGPRLINLSCSNDHEIQSLVNC